MFTRLTAFLLLAAFAAQTFHRTIIVVDYYANTAAFAKDCINKARPMLHCNGKCQMMKKLKEQEKKEQENSERKTDNRNDVVSSRSFFATVPSAITATIKRSFLLPPAEPVTLRPHDIFHPPRS